MTYHPPDLDPCTIAKRDAELEDARPLAGENWQLYSRLHPPCPRCGAPTDESYEDGLALRCCSRCLWCEEIEEEVER